MSSFKEDIEEKLERLGACGMGYPSEGLPCVRPKDHDGPLNDCFAVTRNEKGEIAGCFMGQDYKSWVTDISRFPKDLVVSTPFFEQKMEEAVPDRRGLVAHSRGKS